MRKVIFTLCLLGSLAANAQYKPMLKPGRMWEMAHHTVNPNYKDDSEVLGRDIEYHTVKSYMLFVGDSFMDENGHTCYNIIYGDERSDIKPYTRAQVYEENGKLYEIGRDKDLYAPQSPRLMIDFTVNEGDDYPYYIWKGDLNYRKVINVDSIQVNGETYKRINLGTHNYDSITTSIYIIEGIGMSNDYLAYWNWTYPKAANGLIEWNSLKAVYDNGNCIFRASDFAKDTYRPTTSIWKAGMEWDVYYDNTDAEGPSAENLVISYSLSNADNGYLALTKTEIKGGVKGEPELQGYIRNENDELIYVRPVMEDGSIGEECILYDFRMPYEYGNSVKYGITGGKVVEERIDWKTDVLEYYMLNDDTRYLPACNGIVYKYGYIGGPMELFLMKESYANGKRPKSTNISHVIFGTKGSRKIMRINAPDNDDEIVIPYSEMLTDGMKWECLAASSETDKHTYFAEVKGDTLIGNRNCKLVYSSEDNASKVMFEEGRKVYSIDSNDEAHVLFDFGLQKGEMLDETACVLSIDSVTNQGYKYRAITIDTGQDCPSVTSGNATPWCYKLIEGIGSDKDLLRCWKNGILAYQVPWYDETGITDVNIHTYQTVFDLQGRRLTNVSRKGIYINNGKKVIIR